MKDINAIEVRNIKKSFKVYMDKGHTLKEMSLFAKRRKYTVREAIKDISFDVKKGEAIGLIGNNGCGKSTTLKMLCKIVYPDSGTIETKGRISSLIELGAGFHPDMSGRDNIYINASIFGLTKKEIDAKLDDIIKFSELEKFIDNPVRTYSSGMYMRLAFSVAINVDADILLIDEILGVGDAAFQKKCYEKLKEIKENGTTIVVVSHSLNQIEQICERSLWIQEGEIIADAEPSEVHPIYLKYMMDSNHQIDLAALELLKNKPQANTLNAYQIKENTQGELGNEIEITKTEVFKNGEMLFNNEILTGEKISFRFEYKVNKPIYDVVIDCNISNIYDQVIYETSTAIDGKNPYTISKDGEFIYEVGQLPLLKGMYMFRFKINYTVGSHHLFIEKKACINVVTDSLEKGDIRINHNWGFKDFD